LRNSLVLILLGSCVLAACGGGSVGSGPPIASLSSPSASFSTNGLIFGDEVVDTASQPLPITLTNSGTATLSITSIAASENFAETNNCGTTLAAGANCVINVTLEPTITGSVSGTVSFTDDAAGSPQAVSLSGTGTMGTTQYTLNGICTNRGSYNNNSCEALNDPAQCPVGQEAATLAHTAECPSHGYVDTSTSCNFTNDGMPVSGVCVVQATQVNGSCSVQGQECGAAELPPCCSGFVCAAASDPAFCQPTTGEDASRATSRGKGLADRLR
jgi:Abnormal spindle-like microcephaly-assoc'd, ASPM-SPD-2-Hydin